MAEKGGMVGRGILLDFGRYAEKHGIEYDVNSNYAISLQQLKAMMQEAKLVPRQGDILIIRTGFSKWLHNCTEESGQNFNHSSTIGIDPSMETIEWIWDNNFAAVGTDSLGFEALPAADGSGKFSN